VDEAGDCLPLAFCEVLKRRFFSGGVGDGRTFDWKVSDMKSYSSIIPAISRSLIANLTSLPTAFLSTFLVLVFYELTVGRRCNFYFDKKADFTSATD
jgi:hypothetical protein